LRDAKEPPVIDLSFIAIIALAAVSAGLIAWVFLYPILSGEARAEKRQEQLVQGRAVGNLRKPGERVLDAAARKKQVAESIKELEDREAGRKNLSLEDRIAQAGLSWSRKQFFMICAVTGVAVGLMMFNLTGNMIAGLMGLIAGGAGFPNWYIGMRKKKRIAAFIEEFPNAIDVIVRGVRSGLPLGDCLRIIALEAKEPVKSEFKAIVEAQQVGLSVAEACGTLFRRMPITEANFFGIVIQIQQKAGGNLSEALGNLSRVLRERKKLKAKVQAFSAEAKASAGIIAALPPAVAILVYFSTPSYISMLWIKQSGQIALVCCAFWMLMGILIMRKMINFDF
jgi:tight adherence protein B